MSMKILFIALFGLICFAPSSNSQATCYGLDCGVEDGTGREVSTEDEFSTRMIDIAIDQDVLLGRFNPQRTACYKKCAAAHRSRSSDCRDAFSDILRPNPEALSMCIGISREEMFTCLGLTGAQQCNGDFPD